jgi:hypothetical protein
VSRCDLPSQEPAAGNAEGNRTDVVRQAQGQQALARRPGDRAKFHHLRERLAQGEKSLQAVRRYVPNVIVADFSGGFEPFQRSDGGLNRRMRIVEVEPVFHFILSILSL